MKRDRLALDREVRKNQTYFGKFIDLPCFIGSS